LQALKAEADAVICLPNQKLFKMIDEHTNMVDTFNISNDLLGQGVAGVWRLLTRTGLINVDFADLCSVTRGRHSESYFAAAEADGDNRSSQVMEKLLTHPLLDGGQMLNESPAVLVSLVGGPDLTMAEVNRIMEQINRHCENAHMIMGAAVDESLLGRVRVTLVASCGAERELPEVSPRASGGRSSRMGPTENSGRNAAEHDTQFLDKAGTPRPPSRFIPPAPEMSEGRKVEMFERQGESKSRRKASNMKQGQLDLEIVSKGRFEKSLPTIHHGEDLDVPTYIRRGVPLN
jgi:cell division protein FtsZ